MGFAREGRELARNSLEKFARFMGSYQTDRSEEKEMPQYRYKDALGESDEITVIEDKGMYQTDANGNWTPGYEFIDSRTVKAHPFIIEVLLEDAERLWSIDDVLGALEG